MLVLFDNGTPRKLARYLIGRHTVTEGWDRLENGELLSAAEAAGFEVLLTTDKTSATNRIFKSARSRLSPSGKDAGPLSSPTFLRSWQKWIKLNLAHSRK